MIPRNTKKDILSFSRRFLLEHPFLNPYGFKKNRFTKNISREIRILPEFLIIGYHKCGTTSLYNYLNQHPNIGKSSRKEIQYFTLSYWRGEKWYRTYFPTILTKRKIEKKTGCKFITGEATPQYIFHPKSLNRIKSDLPNVKIIVLLRNPIDRAFSHFMHNLRINNENVDTFEEAIELDEIRYTELFEGFEKDSIKEYEIKKFLPPYLKMGKYIEQIKKLFVLFSPKQIMILDINELEKEPFNTVNRVFRFLELPNLDSIDTEKKNIGNYSNTIKEDTKNKLKDYYKESIVELESFLNRKFNWID